MTLQKPRSPLDLLNFNSKMDAIVAAIAGRNAVKKVAGKSPNDDGDIPLTSFQEEMIEAFAAMSPANRNGIFRGKNLGVTIHNQAEMQAFLDEHNVQSGQFTGLYLGDYITIQDGTYNKQWFIAGFDCKYNNGDTVFGTHHLCLVPKGSLLSAVMNDTNTTAGNYPASKMYTTTLPTVETKLNAVLGTNLLSYPVYNIDNVDTNVASSALASWKGASTISQWKFNYYKVSLMSEVEVYGCPIFSSSAYDNLSAPHQLPVFKFRHHNHPDLVGRNTFWLRNVAYSTSFCYADANGAASYNYASRSGAVVPLICVG